MSKQLFTVLNTFNQALRKKKEKALVPYSKATLAFVNFLYQQNILDRFFCDASTITCHFKKNQGHFVLQQLINPGRKGQMILTTVPILWLNGTKNFGFFICSTTNGLVSDKTCLRLKLGGPVVCYVSLYFIC